MAVFKICSVLCCSIRGSALALKTYRIWNRGYSIHHYELATFWRASQHEDTCLFGTEHRNHINTNTLEINTHMKRIIQKVKSILREILMGFRIAEENRNKSQWGKF